ncbi:Hypothetical predicted protein [Lecanosticta acicola]|uniref:Uncharacterized protein n=1 Tax=Lecanosticta acicola TaxID=111012 RepID=A0AAI9EF68_9PEZI|nr:Hypothetical predicted protein [Lecanosticta acicola]
MSYQQHESEQTSRLLDLPGELRNRIYREALLEDPVTVTASSFIEPGIIRACKQTRSEAGPIFYAENEFEIEVRAYNSDVIIQWQKVGEKVEHEFKVGEVRSRVASGQQTPHWANFEQWLHRVRAKVITVRWEPPSPEDGGGAERRCLRNLYRFAELASHLGDSEYWSVLSDCQLCLKIANPLWAGDISMQNPGACSSEIIWTPADFY